MKLTTSKKLEFIPALVATGYGITTNGEFLRVRVTDDHFESGAILASIINADMKKDTLFFSHVVVAVKGALAIENNELRYKNKIIADKLEINAYMSERDTAQDTPTQNTPTQNTPTQDTPTQDTPIADFQERIEKINGNTAESNKEEKQMTVRQQAALAMIRSLAQTEVDHKRVADIIANECVVTRDAARQQAIDRTKRKPNYLVQIDYVKKQVVKHFCDTVEIFIKCELAIGGGFKVNNEMKQQIVNALINANLEDGIQALTSALDKNVDRTVAPPRGDGQEVEYTFKVSSKG